MERIQQYPVALGKYTPVLLVDLFDNLIQRLFLVSPCRLVYLLIDHWEPLLGSNDDSYPGVQRMAIQTSRRSTQK